MIVFRCSLEAHLASTLAGEGAMRYGGRWNSKGVPAIYTAESRILAVLELVIRQPIDKICAEYRILPIEVPDKVMEPKIPHRWKHDESITRKIGDSLLKDTGTLVVKIPSALLANSYNFIINPRSNQITKVKLLQPEQILMDNRLLEALRK
jgi:RES domain-containing protein